MSERPTKERILDAAEEIMLARSFHSVGLNQILAAVEVPKGSFYHYFASKEQFGVEMLRHYANGSSEYKRRMLLDGEIETNPLQRLYAFFNSMIGKIQENGGRCPCLIQKLASEVADFSEPMRVELAESFADSIEILKQLLDEAVSKRQLPGDFETAKEAALIQDLWFGALQRATIYRKIEPLRQAVTQIHERLGDGA
ncbi:MAG: TetR/AcrR family transcriptional regulator [Verrucomicrobiales bacterium]